MTSSRSPRLDGLDDGDEFPAPGRLTFADWVVLALGAARRRKLTVVGVFLLGVAATVGYYLWREPTYRVDAKILAQRSQALPSAVRAVYEDVPTRSAWEMMHRRDGLIAIVRQARLLPEQQVPGGPSGEAAVTPAPPVPANGVDDPLEKVLRTLDEQLRVTTEEGIISVSLDWPDPAQAYQIVQGVVSNFLEARHLQEVTAIDEVMAVLRARAAQLRTEVDEATEDVRNRTPAPRPTARARQPSAELLRLQSMLEAKGRAIQDVEEFRRRRLADLQAQLDQARNTMSDAHPTVISLRKDIEALGRESPQIQALREEERTLRRQYGQGLAHEGIGYLPSAAVPQALAQVSPEEDPRVRHVRVQYEQILTRINSAQVELDAARAAFKYRYSVVWPPQLPSEPISPDPRKLSVLGGLASLLLALLAAAAPDLARGRIVERWQVEKSLGLDVIGEVRRQA